MYKINYIVIFNKDMSFLGEHMIFALSGRLLNIQDVDFDLIGSNRGTHVSEQWDVDRKTWRV